MKEMTVEEMELIVGGSFWSGVFTFACLFVAGAGGFAIGGPIGAGVGAAAAGTICVNH